MVGWQTNGNPRQSLKAKIFLRHANSDGITLNIGDNQNRAAADKTILRIGLRFRWIDQYCNGLPAVGADNLLFM